MHKCCTFSWFGGDLIRKPFTVMVLWDKNWKRRHCTSCQFLFLVDRNYRDASHSTICSFIMVAHMKFQCRLIIALVFFFVQELFYFVQLTSLFGWHTLELAYFCICWICLWFSGLTLFHFEFTEFTPGPVLIWTSFNMQKSSDLWCTAQTRWMYVTAAHSFIASFLYVL